MTQQTNGSAPSSTSTLPLYTFEQAFLINAELLSGKDYTNDDGSIYRSQDVVVCRLSVMGAKKEYRVSWSPEEFPVAKILPFAYKAVKLSARIVDFRSFKNDVTVKVTDVRIALA